MGGTRGRSRRTLAGAAGEPEGDAEAEFGGCVFVELLLSSVKVYKKKNVHFYDKRKRVCHHSQLTLPLTICILHPAKLFTSIISR